MNLTASNSDSSSLKLAAICVDDDPYVLQMLEIQLREIFRNEAILLELITDPSTTIQQIDYLQSNGFEIAFLITDYRMPEMSGYELIYAVKTKYPELECILLSGQADKFELRELLHTEVITSFINKPWKLQDLNVALSRISKLTHKLC
jgi:YesN/AraC family two-component response regulator